MLRGLVLRVVALLLLATGPVLAGVPDRDGDCRIVVACLGDSNTDDLEPLVGLPKWCTRLGAAAEWTVVNLAVGGAWARRPVATPWDGPAQLERARAYRPDAVVIALGTNDVGDGRNAEETLAALGDLAAGAAAMGATAWIATIPVDLHVTFTPDHEAVRRTVNAALRRTAAPFILEFDDGFGAVDLWWDGLHLLGDAQARRAARALAALSPAAAPCKRGVRRSEPER